MNRFMIEETFNCWYKLSLPDMVAVVYSGGNFPTIPSNPHWKNEQNAGKKIIFESITQTHTILH